MHGEQIQGSTGVDSLNIRELEGGGRGVRSGVRAEGAREHLASVSLLPTASPLLLLVRPRHHLITAANRRSCAIKLH